MASLGINLGMALGGGIFGQLAQHSLRLKDATNENVAAYNAAASVYADIQDAINQFNQGRISNAGVIEYMQQIDAYVMKYLQSQVGKPGTAWSAIGKCNKQCTVGCCLYYSYIHPRILKTIAAFENPVKQTFSLAIVPGNKYHRAGVPGFSITINPPIASLSSLVNDPVDTIPGAVSQIGNKIRTALSFGNSTSTQPRSGQPQNNEKWIILALAALGIALVLRNKQ